MFYSQGDCVLLPIYHSSAEELAQYLFFEFIRLTRINIQMHVYCTDRFCFYRAMGVSYLLESGVRSVDVGIIEVQDQAAHFRLANKP
jgi:hypothetical protein